MRQLLILALTALLLLPLSGRERVEVPSQWRFSGLFTAQEGYPLAALPNGYAQVDFDDSGWKSRSVPGNWCWDLPAARQARFSSGVYRQRVMIPAGGGERVLLHFDGAAYDTHLWVNGKSVGMHRGAYASFYMDITAAVERGKENLLVVRCDFTTDKSRRATLNDYPGPGERAGLWGRVWMEIVPATYIRQVLVDSLLESESLRLRARVVNTTGKVQALRWQVQVRENTSVVDLGRFQVAPGESVIEGRLKMNAPQLWSQENPRLYHLESTLISANGVVVDGQQERFGYCKFQVDGRRFRFNGKPIFLKARHFNGVQLENGAARRTGGFDMPWDEQKALVLKQCRLQGQDNVNMLRAHSAHGDPKFVYDAADEAGVMVYQEWSTFGVGKNLLPEYLPDAAEEISEWLYMVYNNPSVVMFSFANESPGFKEQTRCYDLLKPRFGERFVLCSSSGMLPLLSGTINDPPKTDILDFHTYVGMSFRVMMADEKVSYQRLTENTHEVYRRAQKSWEQAGMNFHMPFVAMEVPAGSWNVAHIDPPARYYDPDGTIPPQSYIRAKELSEQQGALPLGAWDMKNASLADKFAGEVRKMEILNKIDKHSIEGIRKNPLISGVCVGGVGRNAPTVQSLVYQDILPLMKEYDLNTFAGDTFRFTMILVNDSPKELPAGELELTLRQGGKELLLLREQPDGHLRQRQVVAYPAIPAGSRREVPVAMTLLPELPAGDYRLDVRMLLPEQNSVGVNNYPLLIGRRDELLSFPKVPGRVLLLGANSSPVAEVLRQLKVDFTTQPLTVAPEALLAQLSQYRQAIIAPAAIGALKGVGAVLRRWVEAGGQLLALEVDGTGALPFCPEWELGNEGASWFVDIGPGRGHPFARGMRQEHFDSWNGDYGYIAHNMILPMNVNMLAVAVCVESDQLGVPLAEATLGKGRVMVSQMRALQRFMRDPAATKYLLNLLDYFLAQPIFPKVQPLAAGKKYRFDLDLNKCFFVELRPYVNRGFTDSQPGDRTGWTDQGDNDLRHIPQGRMDEDKRVWEIVYNESMVDKQIFCGVPFDVIEQKSNGGKACIVLKGELRPSFPAAVTGIKVGRKARSLYFLHTGVFGGNGKYGEYIVRYADGSSQRFELHGKSEIADWWGPQHLKNALMAWCGVHPVTRQRVGVYACEFKNPHPQREIAAIDFISTGKAVPILLAITGVCE